MSHQDMSNSVIADPIEFAREGRRLSGEVAVASLDRLTDLLADGSGNIVWTVTGSEEVDQAGGSRKFLQLEAEGELHLVCQRCLGVMDYALRLENRLELIAPGQEWPEEELEDDTCDAIEAERDLQLVPLLEDEILLVLPPAPRHDECSPPETSGTKKVSPFAALAGLKIEKH